MAQSEEPKQSLGDLVASMSPGDRETLKKIFYADLVAAGLLRGQAGSDETMMPELQEFYGRSPRNILRPWVNPGIDPRRSDTAIKPIQPLPFWGAGMMNPPSPPPGATGPTGP